MFEGIAKFLTGSGSGSGSDPEPTPTPNKKSFVETIDKAIVDRETDTGFISVSDDGKNVTLLGYTLPTDVVPEDHSFVERYGVLLYRQGEKSRDEFVILDAETSIGDAQNYAIELVENNRTNTYYARVFVGVPWTFNGRAIFRGFVSFWLISRSAAGLANSKDFADVIDKTKISLKDANIPGFLFDDSLVEKDSDSATALAWIKGFGMKPIAKSSAAENRYIHFLDKSAVQAIIKSKVVKRSTANLGSRSGTNKFTTEPWIDPTNKLSVEDLSKCVPTTVLEFVNRYTSIDGSPLTKSMLAYPYKAAVDGKINVNAVKKILSSFSENNGNDSWENEMPPSVCKAVNVELREVIKAAITEISHDVSFIAKASTLERGLVYGIVYEPLVKDTEDDFATAEDIEKAAHNYLPSAMQDVEHDSDQVLTKADSTVVESYIAPCDFTLDDETVTKGSWVLVTKVHSEELLGKIISGEITGYSMAGTAFKV